MPVKQAWPTLKICHWQVFLTLRSADADQGLCPWTPLHFLTLCKFDWAKSKIWNLTYQEENEAKKAETALRGLIFVTFALVHAPIIKPPRKLIGRVSTLALVTAYHPETFLAILCGEQQTDAPQTRVLIILGFIG